MYLRDNKVRKSTVPRPEGAGFSPSLNRGTLSHRRQLGANVVEVEVNTPMRHDRTQTDQNREVFVLLGISSTVLAAIVFLVYLGLN